MFNIYTMATIVPAKKIKKCYTAHYQPQLTNILFDWEMKAPAPVLVSGQSGRSFTCQSGDPQRVSPHYSSPAVHSHRVLSLGLL